MKVLLLGASGQLGSALERQLVSVARVVSYSRLQLDITDYAAVTRVVDAVHPDVIINAAAYTAVDQAEKNRDAAFLVNAEAVSHLAQIATLKKSWLIHYSSDYVFDGEKKTPYLETDSANPINVYGASKLAGERAIISAGCEYWVFRTSWVIGGHGNNFAKTMLRLAQERSSLRVIADQRGVPTSTSLIAAITVNAIQALIAKKPWPVGIYHTVPRGMTSWYEIAKTLLSMAQRHSVPLQCGSDQIIAIRAAEYQAVAQRPSNSQLNTQKLCRQLTWALPHWRDDFMKVAHSLINEVKMYE